MAGKLPNGYKLWGNYGDGKWRISPPYNCHGNVIDPANSKEEAISLFWKYYNTLNKEN